MVEKGSGSGSGGGEGGRKGGPGISDGAEGRVGGGEEEDLAPRPPAVSRIDVVPVPASNGDMQNVVKGKGEPKAEG